MKIEAAESLFLSWLRHVKECQLVQTNWKPSPQWERKNEDVLEQMMQKSSETFQSYDLYKGNKGIEQLLKQAEIDVLGIAFDEGKGKIYAIDVAFHEAGLNYGSKEETVARVIKKCLRTAMCIFGYFSYSVAEIIFASPKINPAVEKELTAAIDDMNNTLREVNLNYKIRIIANDDFKEHIFSPLLMVLNNVADTSELFMRSLQLYMLTGGMQNTMPLPKSIVKPLLPSIITDDPFSEMKIGVIAKTVFRNILESGKIPEDEIERMQDKDYSKDTFGIQYPVLRKTNNPNSKKPDRYYAKSIKIYDQYYFICSEWVERHDNNDRPYLIKWLKSYL
jgi:hypothetical protein